MEPSHQYLGPEERRSQDRQCSILSNWLAESEEQDRRQSYVLSTHSTIHSSRRPSVCPLLSLSTARRMSMCAVSEQLIQTRRKSCLPVIDCGAGNYEYSNQNITIKTIHFQNQRFYMKSDFSPLSSWGTNIYSYFWLNIQNLV